LKFTSKHSLKSIILISFLVLGFIIQNSSKVSGEYTITPSDKFTFVLEQADWLVEFDDESQLGYGGTYNDITITDESTFTVDVLAVSNEWGVDFQISNSTHTTTDSLTNDQFKFEFSRFMYYPLIECQRIIDEGFDAKAIKRGPTLLPWFFVLPSNTTWDFLDNLTTMEFHSSLPYEPYIEGFLQAELERFSGEILFDLSIQGTYVNLTENSNLQLEHMVKFVWNETTGVLLGYRMATYFRGTYLGFQIFQEAVIVCRKLNYNLPNFRFVSAFIPGYSYLMAIASLGSAVGITTIIVRKKRK